MAEKYHGRTYTTREELGLPPLSDEKIAEAKKAFAEFDARRAAIPLEERRELPDRFGAHDFDWPEDDDDDQHAQTSVGEPNPATPTPPTLEQPDTNTDDSGGIPFRI